MRLFFWAEQLWLKHGGAENWAERYVLSMADRGFDVVVATLAANEKLSLDTVQALPVHRLPINDALSSGDPRQWFAVQDYVRDLLSKVAPNCIHLNLDVSAAFLVPLIRSYVKTPTLVTLHNEWSPADASRGSPIDLAVRHTSWMTSGSAFTLDWARQLWPAMTRRSSLIPLAVPITAYEPRPVAEFPLKILCAGRHSDEKGYDIALRAFVLVSKEMPDAELVIAGDGPQRQELELGAQLLGIANQVKFIGWVPPEKMNELFDRTSVLWVPSRRESFGLIALEAALAARPTIASRVGGLPELIEDGVTGLLVPPNSVEALAGATLKLFASPGAAATLGAIAQKRAAARFSWDQHIDGYAKLLTNLAAQD